MAIVTADNGKIIDEFHAYIRNEFVTVSQEYLARFGVPSFDGEDRFQVVSRMGLHLQKYPYPLGGKNIAGFDLRFLPDLSIPRGCGHRVVDIGNLYLRPDDAKVPDLTECMRRAGVEGDIPHKAIFDARFCAMLHGRWATAHHLAG